MSTAKPGLIRIAVRFAVAGAALAATLATGATAAAAGDTAISPGQTLRYVTARGTSTCTLGLTFVTYAHTFGVTAGHCVAENRGYIVNVNSGARGRVAVYDYDRTRPGNDYALIDFGNTASRSTLLGAPVAGVTAPPASGTICHTGTASGTSCAALASGHGTQYLTTGIADAAGDSGGPVWTRYGLDDIAIVGIWLGTHHDNAGNIYGRFFPIKEALTGLA